MALVVLGAVDQVNDVVNLMIADRSEQLCLGTILELSGSFSIKSVMALRSRWAYLKLSVPARVRLEYRISFLRVDTSAMVRGSSPRALHKSTWNAKVSR